MNAVWFDQFGTPEGVLNFGKQEDPVVGPEEALIQMSTSGINPSDVKKRGGAFSNLLDDGFVIPHSDGAGKIIEVGKNISTERIGE